MAIVAWQPGPNRILQVPTEVRALELRCSWEKRDTFGDDAGAKPGRQGPNRVLP